MCAYLQLIVAYIEVDQLVALGDSRRDFLEAVEGEVQLREPLQVLHRLGDTFDAVVRRVQHTQLVTVTQGRRKLRENVVRNVEDPQAREVSQFERQLHDPVGGQIHLPWIARVSPLQSGPEAPTKSHRLCTQFHEGLPAPLSATTSVAGAAGRLAAPRCGEGIPARITTTWLQESLRHTCIHKQKKSSHALSPACCAPSRRPRHMEAAKGAPSCALLPSPRNGSHQYLEARQSARKRWPPFPTFRQIPAAVSPRRGFTLSHDPGLPTLCRRSPSNARKLDSESRGSPLFVTI